MEGKGGLIFFIIAVAITVLLLIWQSYQFLYTGDWTELSIMDVLKLIPKDPELKAWIVSPVEWKGLHSALEWLHPGGALIIVSLFYLNPDKK